MIHHEKPHTPDRLSPEAQETLGAGCEYAAALLDKLEHLLTAGDTANAQGLAADLANLASKHDIDLNFGDEPINS